MKIEIQGIENDISKESAIRAHHAISFRPEERGARMVEEYIQTLTELAQIIENEAKDEKQQDMAQELFDRMRERYKRLYSDWISAKSRCLSSVITGGSNFPVRRAEKANASEHKKMMAVYEFGKSMEKYVKKSLAKVYTAQETQLSDIEKMKRNIEASKKLQDDMKSGNKFYRAVMKDINAKKPEGMSDSMAEKIRNYKPQYSFDRAPFAPYQMQNNLANIKRMEQRLKELESKNEVAAEEGERSKDLNGLKIVQNFTEDRLQLIFDDKPEEDVRSVLKSHGFKWSPRFNAWQRKLTNNAMYSLNKLVLPKEEMKRYA